jgi:hypothetical protein
MESRVNQENAGPRGACRRGLLVNSLIDSHASPAINFMNATYRSPGAK